MENPNQNFLSIVQIHKKHSWNPYEIHRCLWELFPSVEKNSDRPFLFRVEDEKQKISFHNNVLMQSTVEPIKNSDRATVIDTKRVCPDIRTGSRLKFFCRANPTMRDFLTGKRKPIFNIFEQSKWIGRKFKEAAKVTDLMIDKQRIMNFIKNDHTQRIKGKITTIDFQGVLHVEADDSFRYIWTNGIGSAKAFGCGMVSIAGL